MRALTWFQCAHYPSSQPCWTDPSTQWAHFHVFVFGHTFVQLMFALKWNWQLNAFFIVWKNPISMLDQVFQEMKVHTRISTASNVCSPFSHSFEQKQKSFCFFLQRANKFNNIIKVMKSRPLPTVRSKWWRKRTGSTLNSNNNHCMCFSRSLFFMLLMNLAWGHKTFCVFFEHFFSFQISYLFSFFFHFVPTHRNPAQIFTT